VVRNLFDPFRADSSSPQHVREERAHIGGSQRSAKGDDEHGIERCRHAFRIMS
jgi:hypothetical protein